MKDILHLLSALAMLIVVFTILLLAVVGATYLFNVSHNPTTTEHCPKVVRYEDGSMACVVPLKNESESVMVTKDV